MLVAFFCAYHLLLFMIFSYIMSYRYHDDFCFYTRISSSMHPVILLVHFPISKCSFRFIASLKHLIQSDRGVQYTSTKYRELTSEFIRSYSRKGTPWDNACIESFHSLIKREWLNFHKIQNYNHAYRLIFEYIEGFYNTDVSIKTVQVKWKN